MNKPFYRQLLSSTVLILLSLSLIACTKVAENDPVLSSTAGVLLGAKEEEGEITFIHEPLEEEPDELLKALDYNYLLYGYDVIHSPYVHAQKVKTHPILDAAKVKINADKFDSVSNDWIGTKTQEIAVSNVSEIYTKFNNNAKVEYNNTVFSGSVESEYSLDTSKKRNEAYTTYMHMRVLKGERYLGTHEELFGMLSEGFLEDIQKLNHKEVTADSIFKKYGTHLFTMYLIGGRARMNFNYSSSEEMTKEALRLEAEALTTKVKGSVENSNEKVTIATKRSVVTRVSSYGGQDLSGVNLENMHEKFSAWGKTVDSAPTLCGIGDFEDSMVPIWEILLKVGYETAKKSLYDEYIKAAKGQALFLGEMDFQEGGNQYISEIHVGHGDTSEKALSQIPDGYTIVKAGFKDEYLDANKGRKYYIYIGYLPSQSKIGAITDLYVDLGKNTTHSGFSKKDVDLNKNVEGEYVYLYYKKASQEDVENPGTKYIREIRGLYQQNPSPPAGWEEPTITKDLNSGAGGEYIYLILKKK